MKIQKSNYRSLCLMFCDLCIVAGSYLIAYKICNQSIARSSPSQLFLAVLIPAVIYILVFYLFGIYNSLWRYAHTTEFFKCVCASFVAGTLYYLIDRKFASFQLMGYFYALAICMISLGLIVFRITYRMYRNYRGASREKIDGPIKRVLIIGAGSGCTMLLNDLKSRGRTEFLPVLVVDDAPDKLNRSINGIQIRGKIKDIPVLCKEYEIDLIILAIPSLPLEKRAKILDFCEMTNCETKMLPYISELNDSTNLFDKLRKVDIYDLLERTEVNLNNPEIKSFLQDKVIMVTGGGGSIGSELCRQIAAAGPKKLIIVDIYENNAYDIQQELIRKYKGNLNLSVLIASIRDVHKIDQLLATEKPQIIFHAAAHKHVPLMESSPAEAIKNNIFGTLNVVQAAMKHHVEKFILISTDKAVNPTSIMGATKRVCEMIIQSSNGKSDTVFAAVRFGNVLGSNGSVIPLFKSQIEEGGPVTVTHPDIIRYFMTIPEASQLVLNASVMAKGGEIFILNMGEPVKIDDLAKKMISLSGLRLGTDIEIKYTGLRPGEKLFEELLMSEENMEETQNNKIFIGSPINFEPDHFYHQLTSLHTIANQDDFYGVEVKLMEIVDTFKRPSSNVAV